MSKVCSFRGRRIATRTHGSLSTDIFKCEHESVPNGVCVDANSELTEFRGERLKTSCESCPFFNGIRRQPFTFDRTTIINLKRRPDRLEQVQAEIAKGWPFPVPTITEAVDGHVCKAPKGFTEGNYAWACFQSHRKAIETAMNDGCESLLILEDDCTLVDGFSAKATDFMKRIPNDWDIAWFGMRHLRDPVSILPGIVRATSADLMHCYGLSESGLKKLYAFFSQWHAVHCDWSINNNVGKFVAYAADPSLAGQRGGYSDITWREMEEKKVGTSPHLVTKRALVKAVKPASRGECVHRGTVIRSDISNLCGSRGKQIEVYSCDLHGECSLGRYCEQQTVRSCATCGDFELFVPKSGVAWKNDDSSSGRPIHAVMITPSLGMGGAEQWIRIMVTQSDPAKVRWRVVVLDLEFRHPPIANAIADCPNAELHVVGNRPPDLACETYLSSDDALAAAAVNSDVIVSWGGGKWTNPGTGVPMVFTAHGCCVWTKNALAEAVANGTDYLVYVSKLAAKTLGEPVPTKIIWNAVDTSRLVVTRDRTEIQRDIWKTHTESSSQDRVHVGYLGRFSSEKNPIAAAQAVANLPWYYKCVLIGSGANEVAILAQCRAMIPGRFTHVKTVEDVGNHLAALDVFVMASPREGNSLSLAEAMLVGVPIVTTRVGAVEEFEGSAHCELFWSVPDHPTGEELAQAVRSAAEAGRTADRVKAAQKFAEENLTADKMVETWATYLAGIVTSRRLPHSQQT